MKAPEKYQPTFRREGVFHEVEALAIRNVAKMKEKDKEKEPSESPSPGDTGSTPTPAVTSSAVTIPGFKKLTSLSLDPEDAITLRARVIRFKHLANGDQEVGDNAFDNLRRLVVRLAASDANEKAIGSALRELADLFASPHTSVSSFELLRSGLVDGLLHFATDHDREGTFSLALNILCLNVIP
jgi:E3 ubiquitin-protein ligase TRIP12